MSPKMETLRVKGQANLDDDMAVKRRIIESNGLVRSIYGSAENPDFTVFSVDHGTASDVRLEPVTQVLRQAILAAPASLGAAGSRSRQHVTLRQS